MIISIHQSQYLPWFPYLYKISKSDLFIILDTVAFQKNGVQNRNQIKTAQGARWLTVPVNHRLGQLIIDVEIDNSTNWRHKHWTTLEYNYGKAPYFHLCAEELKSVYLQEWRYLNDLNISLLEIILKWFKINTKTMRSSDMKAGGKGSELILNLCKEAGATTYLSGMGGQNYLDEEAFCKADIEILYKSPALPEVYPQRFSQTGFINNLSCIDILLNCNEDWRSLVLS